MHWSRHPPRQTPPVADWQTPPPPPDGHCSGRYASYRNAFLLKIVFYKFYRISRFYRFNLEKFECLHYWHQIDLYFTKRV